MNAVDGCLHDFIDAHETFAEIGGHAGNVPPETECDFLIRGPAEFQAEGCRDSSGVCHEAENMNATVVIRIGIGETAGEAEMIAYVPILDKGVQRRTDIPILANGLRRGN